jgi:pyruvate/2-oxoglutarate/acetoin dehydrogenase E1 component
VEWFKGQLLENGILTEAQAEEEWNRTRRNVEQQTMRAVKSRDPDIRRILDGMFADSTSEDLQAKYKTGKLLKEARIFPRDSEGKILARHAVNEALMEEMLRDQRVCVWGEDVAEAGGAYMATFGLLEVFGRKRIFNAPISESAIIGTGIGAAMAGLRPVVELMYIDFVLQAMDQVGNQAAKARYMFGGQYTIPMVIRATIGGGKGYAGQHSQSLESVVAHFPGIKVIAPSNAYDMKGLLKSAIRDDNPVFFIEHQWVYLDKAVVPTGEYTVPIGVGRVARQGSDITVVCYSNMVPRVLAAAEKLQAEEGISVEVVDPRTLVPLDIELISRSVKKTGRAMIVVQAVYTGGYASHISHEITRTGFARLKAPVRILSAYDVSPPMAFPLESENIPSVDKIMRTIREELKAGGRGKAPVKPKTAAKPKAGLKAKAAGKPKAKAPAGRAAKPKARAGRRGR